MPRFLIWGLTVAAAAAVKCEGTTPPHILFVLSDDLGYHDVGFHGSEISTPFIDSLVASGVHFDNYYGHAICTPSRSAIMSGRYASHNGLQHSYLLTGTDTGLPLKFKTLANHLAELGYHCSMVGKWHLGFQSKAYTPLGRGFSEYFGYLTGGEDYFTHVAGGFLDLHENDTPAPQYNNNYSTPLFANKAAAMVERHDPATPMFMYLAFQSVHSPLEAPSDYVAKFAWITSKPRRTLAAMTNCMDDAIESLVNTYKSKGMWENTLMVFAADNGGPPYVANSNWPMRGGKWTMWEGGTHLTAFAHHGGGLFPKKNYTGLTHHADWVATLVAAAGGVLNDTVLPAPDSVNHFAEMASANASVEGPRRHVLLNVDQTNQVTLNDPGGWSGFAGLVTRDMPSAPGHWKLVFGNPGVPNSWCWPDQNKSTGSIEICNTVAGYAFPGHDIKSGPVAASTAAACCSACQAAATCKGWTWHSGKTKGCWLKTAINATDMEACSPGCISGSSGVAPVPRHPAPGPPAPPAPPSDPMPNLADLTCSYNGRVPANKTGAILFNLAADPTETTNLAAERPDIVAALRVVLQVYIGSAVTPLNLTPAERTPDPAAKDAAKKAGCWVPWQ